MLIWRGGVLKNSPGQYKPAFETEHHSTTKQIPEGKKNQLPKKKRKFSRRIKNNPTTSSQKVQNINPNLSSCASTKNTSSTKNTDRSGAKKNKVAVDDHPLFNLNPTQIRQKARDVLKDNERLVGKISELNSMNSQLQRYLYNKTA